MSLFFSLHIDLKYNYSLSVGNILRALSGTRQSSQLNARYIILADLMIEIMLDIIARIEQSNRARTDDRPRRSMLNWL